MTLDSFSMLGAVPGHYGNAAEEYCAARESAALFDLSGRLRLEFTGTDRVRFLNSFCTNDLKRRGAGEGCEAFVTNVRGKVVGMVFVFLDEDRIWLDVAPGAEERIVPHLERYIINEDVRIRPAGGEFSIFLLTGPEALSRLEQLGIALPEPGPMRHAASQLAGVPVRIERLDLAGGDGLQIVVERAEGQRVRELLLSAFAPAGGEAFEALRIEARIPADGVDITSDHFAQEIDRTDRAISFTKGCYLGQEPIARIDALGHVNRLLRGFRSVAAAIPPAGAEIFLPGTDKSLGAVTSSARSFGAWPTVALGYVRREHAAPSSSVTIRWSAGEIAAELF